MINIASDWREKETQVQNWHLETVGGYEQFPVGFFWHTPPQPALLLYRNLHASLKVTPVYWPFDLDVFFSIIIMIFLLVVIRFSVKSSRPPGVDERLLFLFKDISISC